MIDYAQKGHYYIEEPRFEVKKLLTHLSKRAEVLDIGAGFGNNTKLLLDAGHNVTALEPNAEAVLALKELQKTYPKRLKIVEGAVNTFKPSHMYDVIVCCMVLHFLKDKKTGLSMVGKIKSWTKPKGLNLITCYMDKQNLPFDYSCLLAPGELSATYSKWDIHWCQESYRLTWSRIYSARDVPRLVLGKRGFKASRIIAQRGR